LRGAGSEEVVFTLTELEKRQQLPIRFLVDELPSFDRLVRRFAAEKGLETLMIRNREVEGDLLTESVASFLERL
jgi:hypothetical protein